MSYVKDSRLPLSLEGNEIIAIKIDYEIHASCAVSFYNLYLCVRSSDIGYDDNGDDDSWPQHGMRILCANRQFNLVRRKCFIYFSSYVRTHVGICLRVMSTRQSIRLSSCTH